MENWKFTFGVDRFSSLSVKKCMKLCAVVLNVLLDVGTMELF